MSNLRILNISDILIILSVFSIVVLSLSSTISVLLFTSLIYFFTIVIILNTNSSFITFKSVGLSYYYYFFLFCIVSFFYAQNHSLVFIELVRVLNALLVFYLVGIVVRFYNIDRILNLFLFFSIGLFIYNLINFQFSRNFEYGGVNPVGVLCFYSTFIVFYYYFIGKKWYLLMLPLFLFTLISTASQKAIISLIIGLIILFAIMLFRQKRRNIIRYFFLVVIAVAVTSLIIKFNSSLAYSVDRTSATIESIIFGVEVEGAAGGLEEDDTRTLLIDMGISFWKESPLIGFGLNNSRELFYYKLGRATYTHNTPVEILVSVGFVGFLLYYMFVLKNLFFLIKAYLIGRKEVSVVYIVSIFGMLLMSYFQKMYADLPTMVIMAAGIHVAKINITNKKRK